MKHKYIIKLRYLDVVGQEVDTTDTYEHVCEFIILCDAMASFNEWHAKHINKNQYHIISITRIT